MNEGQKDESYIVELKIVLNNASLLNKMQVHDVQVKNLNERV